MIGYLGVAGVQQLIYEIGVGAFIERLAGQIEDDYRRWAEFEKSVRHASHSAGGVIELMPMTPPMVSPGVHLNAVGSDCPGKTELHADVLRRADVRVVVEYEPQTRVEGEIQQMPHDFPVIQFAQVVNGAKTARTSAAQITIFDSVGFALEDYSALRLLESMLRERPQIRQQIDLVPDLENPKDLFGGTLGRSGNAARKCKVA